MINNVGQVRRPETKKDQERGTPGDQETKTARRQKSVVEVLHDGDDAILTGRNESGQ
jgi:hypothetical protein